MPQDVVKKVSFGVWNIPQLPRFQLKQMPRCLLLDRSVIFEFEVSINDLVESDHIGPALDRDFPRPSAFRMDPVDSHGLLDIANRSSLGIEDMNGPIGET